ncbi:hypothetical protein [Paenibacillus gyeongsangnamensis]
MTLLPAALREEQVKMCWGRIEAKLERMMEQMGDKCPHVSVSGVYDDARWDW